MNDHFDELLSQQLTNAPPPVSVVHATNPWRKALEWVLLGQPLSMLVLDLYGLNYVLPPIGYLLLLLGYRLLRRESGAFRACWVLTLLRGMLFGLKLCFDATFFSTLTGKVADAVSWAEILANALAFVHVCCLYFAIRTTWQRYELPLRKWHGGILIGLACLAHVYLLVPGVLVYFLIFMYLITASDLLRLSRGLTDIGYNITAASVHLSNRTLIVLTASLTATAMLLSGIALRKAPMVFSPASDGSSQAATRETLIALGVPENVVADLTDEDVLRCKDAIQVQCSDQQYEHGLNAQVTLFAIQVPAGRNCDDCWVILHHFRFTQAPLFTGTEALTTRHDGVSGTYWWINPKEDTSGRVLYDRNNTTLEAEFFDISYSWDYDRLTQTARFSFPGGGENYRGYLMYTAELVNSGYILNVVSTLTHQTPMPLYPAQAPTAGNQTLFFRENQTQLQFYPHEQNESASNK